MPASTGTGLELGWALQLNLQVLARHWNQPDIWMWGNLELKSTSLVYHGGRTEV